MPWKAISVVENRLQLICMWMEGKHSVAELARIFGVSRKTAYKIIGRWEKEKLSGLEDRSRRPKTSPNATPPAIRQKILDQRALKPNWGPFKIVRSLKDEGLEDLPALSTVAGILKREGLAAPRKKVRHASPCSGLIDALSPNMVWCTDFKGWFRVQTGERCVPLTLMDSFSRYLLCCEALFGQTRFEDVWHLYERAFSTYGLPSYILSDNGTPFASVGMGGLSRLSVAWIKLGIIPLRIEPGKPQQNGRLKRFHRTLKEETANPPAVTPKAQQTRFEVFHTEYNEVRPHQALGGDTPSIHYQTSERVYNGLPGTLSYPDEMTIRAVNHTGAIKWSGRAMQLSKSLAGEAVGLKLQEDAPVATVFLGNYALCMLDLQTGKTSPVARPVHLLRTGQADILLPEQQPLVIPVMPIGLD